MKKRDEKQKDGFVKLWRSAMQHHLYKETPFDRWHAFEDLFLRAAHAPTTVNFMKQRFKLKRAQLVTTKNQLAKTWGWSWDRVDRFLAYLIQDGMIFVSDAAVMEKLYTPGEYSREDEAADETRSYTRSKTGNPCIAVTICTFDYWQSRLGNTGNPTRSSSRTESGNPTGNPSRNRPGTHTKPTGNEQEGLKKAKKEKNEGEEGGPLTAAPEPLSPTPPQLPHAADLKILRAVARECAVPETGDFLDRRLSMFIERVGLERATEMISSMRGHPILQIQDKYFPSASSGGSKSGVDAAIELANQDQPTPEES